MPDGKANVDRGAAKFDNFVPRWGMPTVNGTLSFSCFFQAHSTGGNHKVDAVEDEESILSISHIWPRYKVKGGIL